MTMGDFDQREAVKRALEHQHAGNLPEAEMLCRQVLAVAPDNADALSLLGIVYCQLKRWELGIGFAGRAVQVNPGVAAYHHHYAEAWLVLGEADQAILAYQKAITLDPSRPEPYAGLGVALHRRGRWPESVAALRQAIVLGLNSVYVDLAKSLLRCGQLDEAEAALGRAETLQPNDAELWQVRGEILGHRQQYPAAVNAFTRAAELAPHYAHPHHGAGVVLALQGDFPAAVAAMERALKLDPDYPEANCGAGAILLRAGRAVDAIAYYEKAIARSPRYLEARADLALAYEKAGRLKDAAAQYEVLAAVTPDEEFFRFQRASLQDGVTPPPAAAPPALVARLFDKYARYFDEHLTKHLGYRAPQLIFQAVARTAPAHNLAILDLGCGTGLCGQLFKPLAARLVGIDLSPAMIEKARERGIYDRLAVADLLEITATVSERFDLVIAGDVFCYIGDLAPVFQRVTKVIRPCGLFAFTVEVSDDADYLLRQTRRYAHAAGYIRKLTQIQGYDLLSLDRTALRSENQHDVEGLVAVLRSR